VRAVGYADGKGAIAVKTQIDEMLAVAIAGQVSAGLTPGDEQERRMRGALIAIGLMVRNTSDSPLVQGALDLIDRTTVTVEGNVTRFSTVLPAEEE
jgi:hypothetical protein